MFEPLPLPWATTFPQRDGQPPDSRGNTPFRKCALHNAVNYTPLPLATACNSRYAKHEVVAAMQLEPPHPPPTRLRPLSLAAGRPRYCAQAGVRCRWSCNG